MDKELFMRAARKAGVTPEVIGHLHMWLPVIAEAYDELDAENRVAPSPAPESDEEVTPT